LAAATGVGCDIDERRPHLVDLSPLSTTGALCLAGVASSENLRSVFNKLLAWDCR